ncbi:OmpA family protein [Arundinibacter roseus]|uniref:Flagellar motor protein MotB n=1 Tax=Arundinibacter roseus TaxID=2070510 RepID=A0A4R4KIW4_9BACT|nr:OmpA family protein [Arundinibacter roseus]TDB68194.1 flagellar motor protein MotB [Arundinibacter roseus]
MKTCRQTLLLAVSMLLLSLGAMAQSARLRTANKQFDNMSYISAVRAYEDFLRLDKRNDPLENREALVKLGYSYRRLQDTRNAERVYGELINKYTDIPSEVYLYYAQSLAANRKYRESQKMYAKYGEMQAEDLRGRKFTVSYMDVDRFYQDSSSYKVDYLPLNSRQADFSPMYYQSGLVFVSARDETGVVKRVFNYNQTPFLDLYFHPDTAQLKGTPEPTSETATLGGGDLDKTDAKSATAEPATLTKTEVFSRTLNTKYHEGPMTFFKDQKRIIFTRNNDDKGKSGKSNEGVRKLKLFYAEQDDKGKWVNIKELPFNSKDYSCGHPALSADDSKLYFVSDMPGGYGGTDLYVVDYKDGQWGTPVNMGREINTEGNEMFPFVDSNNLLYFSSDGHEGLGGLDVFMAELKDDIALQGVQNLGAPINSERDDFGFITDASRTSGYFSSNRKRGASDDNIYSFRRICKQLNIYVYDAKTKEPIETADVRVVKGGVNQELQQTGMDGSIRMCLDAGAEYEFKAIKEGYAANSLRFSTLTQSSNPTMGLAIYLERNENTSIVKGVIRREVDQQPADGVKVTLRNEKKNSEKTVTTGPDGGYEFDMDPNSNYTIKTEKDRYASDQNQIRTRKKGEIVENNVGIYGEGDVFRLDNIYYDLDKFFIRPDAAKELDRVVSLLKKYPQMAVELRSHTDSRASDDYNNKLSERRARAAYDYLVRRGVSPMRLVAKGYGESQPVNECADGENCTESEHQLNRRTEFKILTVQ